MARASSQYWGKTATSKDYITTPEPQNKFSQGAVCCLPSVLLLLYSSHCLDLAEQRSSYSHHLPKASVTQEQCCWSQCHSLKASLRPSWYCKAAEFFREYCRVMFYICTKPLQLMVRTKNVSAEILLKLFCCSFCLVNLQGIKAAHFTLSTRFYIWHKVTCWEWPVVLWLKTLKEPLCPLWISLFKSCSQ